VAIYIIRGMLELGYGHDADALAAFQAGERIAEPLAAPNLLVTTMRAFVVQAVVRLGETEQAEKALVELGEQARDGGDFRIARAMLRLAQDDPHAATEALAPVLDGSAPLIWPTWLAQAFLLEAIAQDALGEEAAAERALERALDYAEPDGALLWFVLHPVPGLLGRLARYRTSHPGLIADIQNLLAGPGFGPPSATPPAPHEPLSESELRVLRYLPTNLGAWEIAEELGISRNTVKTHIRNLYTKLGTHRRTEAVTRARNLGMLAAR
jgi:LuxR family maltose regulon positive regulatory protein